ncbi:hypothetical protein CGRA01v4_07400 [Colletotrichum graminicola]|nr:hypothetical protein CGRA01v4_07400 [Colletotrichum graminicola]
MARTVSVRRRRPSLWKTRIRQTHVREWQLPHGLFNWLIGILSDTGSPGPGYLCWSPPSSLSSSSPAQTQTTPPLPPFPPPSVQPCAPLIMTHF